MQSLPPEPTIDPIKFVLSVSGTITSSKIPYVLLCLQQIINMTNDTYSASMKMDPSQSAESKSRTEMLKELSAGYSGRAPEPTTGSRSSTVGSSTRPTIII